MLNCQIKNNNVINRHAAEFEVIASSALTLLVGLQQEHPVCKNCVMRCWCGYLSGARCRLFAYSLVQLMPLHPKTPSSLASFKSRLVLPFWYRLAQVVLEKRPLNRCSSSSSSIVVFKWLISYFQPSVVTVRIIPRMCASLRVTLIYWS